MFVQASAAVRRYREIHLVQQIHKPTCPPLMRPGVVGVLAVTITNLVQSALPCANDKSAVTRIPEIRAGIFVATTKNEDKTDKEYLAGHACGHRQKFDLPMLLLGPQWSFGVFSQSMGLAPRKRRGVQINCHVSLARTKVKNDSPFS
jgi:hypothetical protein